MRTIFNMLIITGLLTGIGLAQDSLKAGQSDQTGGETTKHGPRFVDENGDGFNDNAPDHDGDGIPNGLDPDYQGQKNRHRRGFQDLDGDGIDDNLVAPEQNRDQHQVGPPDDPAKGNQTAGEDGAREKHQRRKGKNQP